MYQVCVRIMFKHKDTPTRGNGVRVNSSCYICQAIVRPRDGEDFTCHRLEETTSKSQKQRFKLWQSAFLTISQSHCI